MGSFGMRTDTKGGLDVASSYLFVGTNLYQRQTCHSPLTPDHQLNIFTGLMKFLFLTLDEIVFQVEGRPLQTNMCWINSDCRRQRGVAGVNVASSTVQV